MKTPFCFRCGGKAKYQLSLRFQGEKGKVEDSAFWPLCFKCFMEIPWESLLRDAVSWHEKIDNIMKASLGKEV